MSKRLSSVSLFFALLLVALLCVALPRSEAKVVARLVEFTISNSTNKQVAVAFGREGYCDCPLLHQ